MPIKSPTLAATFLAGIFIACSAPAAAKNPTKLVSKEEQVQQIDAIRDGIMTCAKLHMADMIGIQATYMEMQADKMVANMNRGYGTDLSYTEKLTLKKQAREKHVTEGLKGEKCVEQATAAVSTNTRSFVLSFKKKNQPTAKQLLAQWKVTIGTIGQDNFSASLAEFDKVANLLKIDVDMN